jgi:hypothetical protein
VKEFAARLVREVASEKAVNCLAHTIYFGGALEHTQITA